MSIKEEKIGDITVIYAEGNITDDWGSMAQALLLPMIEDPQCSGIILDLTDVKYVDSSGLGIIVSIYKTLKKHSKKLVLSNINKNVEELLILTRLNETIQIEKDVDSSIQSFEEN
ncbi:MAG: STAS domain-containing protein [Proteobacteria bacterium]|nr:STAS domain-containing protein [Pseudomonadota bacterium]